MQYKIYPKWILVIARISTGWLMFYAGITKIFDPTWSAEGYLKSAKTFNGFYTFLAGPNILPIINFINEWGLTLLGLSLILGIFVRWSAYWGGFLMILYYFPVLEFPNIGKYSFIVDEHIIYAILLILLAEFNSGKVFGLDQKLSNWWYKRHSV